MVEDPLVVSITSGTSLNADEVARRTFPSVRKGVDGDAVRRYLESIAAEIRAFSDREAQLRRRILEAERKASEPPVLDEETLTRAVGAETARILQTAHDAAREVVARGEARAAELVAEAETQAADRAAAVDEQASAVLEAASEQAAVLAATALAEATALQEAAQSEIEGLLEAAQEEAVDVLDTTKQRCREAIREAQALRKSVLGDLLERRRALFVQLEQLRSGRDSLVEVVDAVGAAVDELRGRLARAEHEARLAAAEAGDRAEVLVDDEVDTLLDPEVAIELRNALLAGDLDGEAEATLEVDLESQAGAEDLVEEALEQMAEDAIEVLDDLAEALQESADAKQDLRSSASHRSVGELFARIRATRGSGEADTGDLLEEAEESKPVADSSEQAADTQEGGAAEAAAEDVAPQDVAAADDVAVELAAEETPVESTEDTSDAAVISRRDERLNPVVTNLSRALKRALQDDQNELLNAIRQTSGTPDLDTLLPEPPQRERYEKAASQALAEAWRLGRSWLRAADPDGADGDVEVTTLATETGRLLGTELAGELAGLLRHRLTESLRALGDIGEGGQDAAGAAYREWKGARVEGIAGDFATRAFASGAVDAAQGTIVRWVVDDGKPCPDCDDNALAGEQAAGDEWPTGQRHPPVHPGCRCLLVPITH
jgi:hypothetical protein